MSFCDLFCSMRYREHGAPDTAAMALVRGAK